jgi:hypothetical protein
MACLLIWSFVSPPKPTKGHVMKVGQLKKFKRALKAQQTVAIHDLGENREIIAVEGESL